MAQQPVQRQSDLGPPIFFGIFTFAGIAFIVTSKLLQWDPLIVTGVPVALMLGYAGAILMFRRLRLRDDQTGDNFYYMGFIYTLTSLALSLIQFNTGAVQVDEIVVNFGVAVASTIAGIILRIFFNLVRRDPIEVEHVARLELSDASRRVRRELDGMLLEMAHFRRTNQQMLAEGFEEIRAEVRRSTAEATSAVETISKVSSEQASAWAEGSSAQRLNDEMRQLVQSLAGLNGVLAQVVTSTRAAQQMQRPVGFAERLGRLFGRTIRSSRAARPLRPAARQPDLDTER